MSLVYRGDPIIAGSKSWTRLTWCFLSFRVIFEQFQSPSPDSKTPRTGIQLLGIVLANGMVPYDSNTAGQVDEQK